MFILLLSFPSLSFLLLIFFFVFFLQDFQAQCLRQNFLINRDTACAPSLPIHSFSDLGPRWDLDDGLYVSGRQQEKGVLRVDEEASKANKTAYWVQWVVKDFKWFVHLLERPDLNLQMFKSRM